ncbi:NAD(P)H-binding protein [Streptomyces avicenniae]|uniref:NmrA family NAD(P)-binding protein n=1 Tax=Streptomyces avicenniae TaxID=500153 RepID=UPI00069B3F8F|nr:NAD(P)H-binding protein [Streptomyces avicenniae]
MDLVVTTPTGHVGSRVVRLLLQAGVRPRVLVRDPDRLDAFTRERVDVRRGDLTDASFVRSATSGADCVVWIDPTPHTADDANELSRRTVAGLTAALRAGDVGRAILLSSVGAEKRYGVGHIDGLARVEDELEETGADLLVLRCGYFFTNLLARSDELERGVLSTSADPDQAMPWVDPRDVGDIVAARLLAGTWRGRLVRAIHGPEDLTWKAVAENLSGALGRPVELRVVSDDDVRRSLRAAGLSADAAESVVGMTAGLRGLVPEQPRTPITTTPSDLAGWAYTHLRPALAR